MTIIQTPINDSNQSLPQNLVVIYDTNTLNWSSNSIQTGGTLRKKSISNELPNFSNFTQELLLFLNSYMAINHSNELAFISTNSENRYNF